MGSAPSCSMSATIAPIGSRILAVLSTRESNEPARCILSRDAHAPGCITGAGKGIGSATAKAFAREEAWVEITDVDDAAAAATGAAITRELGERVHWQRVDVTDEDNITEWTTAALARHGRIDVLFNNAGISAVWDAVLAVNVTAVYLVSRAIVRFLRVSRFDASGCIGGKLFPTYAGFTQCLPDLSASPLHSGTLTRRQDSPDATARSMASPPDGPPTSRRPGHVP